MARFRTPRLTLDEFTERDTAPVLAVLNDPDFIRNVADRGVRSEAQARDYLRATILPSYGRHRFGMYRVRLADGADIGMCGLVKREQFEHPDIGFAFLPQFRSRGYAFEAASAVMQFARAGLGLRVIYGLANPDNRASVSLLEKLGLRLRDRVRMAGDASPVLLMAWETGES
ncbi:GNAT family N-acetyltransferase [Microbulbifer yueqingensis]|uniref:Protein N-acetyltransferase, RimJ/RimL family n=1 Tax=Microbulbifer yueqingensis TaxID=658219 RepID=A0A1G8XA85_9GAMM|nr:GNAT family N-acetyltransferase [Microbulbifer yueqingensis]SDJ87381.1 Protein N-acetyltransferase, RimJ/RimL family [Microbulbifer yueqingensis]